MRLRALPHPQSHPREGGDPGFLNLERLALDSRLCGDDSESGSRLVDAMHFFRLGF